MRLADVAQTGIRDRPTSQTVDDFFGSAHRQAGIPPVPRNRRSNAGATRVDVSEGRSRRGAMVGSIRMTIWGGFSLAMLLSTQAFATLYECRDGSESVIFTDSIAQLEQCSPLTTGEAVPPPTPEPPPFDPNVPLIQVPTKPGYPPEFVPATDIDPETNPFTTTTIYPQVMAPKASPGQAWTPQAPSTRTFPQPPSTGEAAPAAP